MKNSLKHSRILVVDDSEFSCALITQILGSNGYDNITISTDGQDALEKTKNWHPDIVLLDIGLPIIDGHEYCKRVRSISEFKETPILVQTGISDAVKRNEMFKEGATDLITKPIDAAELISRLQIHLERQALIKDLGNYRKVMEGELVEARTMQNLLMPSSSAKKNIFEKYGVQIGDFFKPSSTIGGDFWGVRELSDKEFAFYIVDFSGHGVTSALNTFRLHTIIEQTDIDEAKHPEKYLESLNNTLNTYLGTGQFATMFYGVVNVADSSISYASACSPVQIYIPNKEDSKIISHESLPLAVKRDIKFDLNKINFNVGDHLFLCSDAFIETKDRDNNFLTIKEISNQLRTLIKKNEDTQEVVDQFISNFYKYVPIKNIRDDMTINLFHRLR